MMEWVTQLLATPSVAQATIVLGMVVGLGLALGLLLFVGLAAVMWLTRRIDWQARG